LVAQPIGCAVSADLRKLGDEDDGNSGLRTESLETWHEIFGRKDAQTPESIQAVSKHFFAERPACYPLGQELASAQPGGQGKPVRIKLR